jgi:DNA-binding MarR family transcriptional regulator
MWKGEIVLDEQRPANARIQAVRDAQSALYHRMLRVHKPEWIDLDLSMGQLKTLMTVASDGPITITALADTLGVGKPAASILADRLVQLGYAFRAEDPRDRRRTYVSSTTAGNTLVTQLRQGTSDRFARWLEAMAPDDLDALARGLQALADAIGRATTKTAETADTTETTATAR